MNNLIFSDIRCGSHCVTGWHWRAEAGTHPCLTLWCVTGGCGTLRVGDSVFPICRGDIFLLDYSQTVTGEQDDSNPLSVCFVDFLPTALSFPNFPVHKKIANLDFIMGLFDRVHSALIKADDASLWLSALLREYISLNDDATYPVYSSEINELCRQMRQSPADKYVISGIARGIGLSCDHFIRIFKSAAGLSPYAYIQLVRLELARSCLINSNISITDISLKCGFADPYQFSRFFKKQTGLSPSAYRKTALTPSPR